MTDVSLYVAVVSASAAVVGATIPQVGVAVQTALQARRDRRERYELARRQACVKLMRAAEDLRTQVANNHDYHGDEMGQRLAQVRKYAAAAEVHAVRIGLLAPPALAGPAQDLAAAASRLAEKAADNTDIDRGVSEIRPDFGELDTFIEAFKTAAVKGRQAPSPAGGGKKTARRGGAERTRAVDNTGD